MRFWTTLKQRANGQGELGRRYLKIAKWAINNMQDNKGYFYYQKTRWYTNKIPYMRWSQAWMFYALAQFLSFPETAQVLEENKAVGGKLVN